MKDNVYNKNNITVSRLMDELLSMDHTLRFMSHVVWWYQLFHLWYIRQNKLLQ